MEEIARISAGRLVARLDVKDIRSSLVVQIEERRLQWLLSCYLEQIILKIFQIARLCILSSQYDISYLTLISYKSFLYKYSWINPVLTGGHSGFIQYFPACSLGWG